ncbi:tripartite tricarboxylate transporter TctB family protein [Ochrobactrum sp. CM-21-5]|nr:tripartite tricarboxylate transporter TctB family protein [Ochrobactrum sp. CM-21-5]
MAFVKYRRSGEIFIEFARLKPVLGFIVPLIAFAAIPTFLGLYVGTPLYIACAMMFQGRYKWWIALPAGVAVSLFFFVVFDIGFKVPLLKGPIEAFFGIY